MYIYKRLPCDGAQAVASSESSKRTNRTCLKGDASNLNAVSHDTKGLQKRKANIKKVKENEEIVTGLTYPYQATRTLRIRLMERRS